MPPYMNHYVVYHFTFLEWRAKTLAENTFAQKITAIDPHLVHEAMQWWASSSLQEPESTLEAPASKVELR